MAVYVNTNYSALQGQRYLGNVQNSLTTTYQRLSSGMRINSAKDDAAGLQIADRLTSQINGLNQGNRNASDGLALAQTIESGLDEISGMLQKIRTLTVQANNGTNTAEDRAALAKEASALGTEINRIVKQTTFAGKTVLNGTNKAANNNSIYPDSQQNAEDGKLTLQIGSNKGDTITFTVKDMLFSKVAGTNDLIGEKDKFINIDKNTNAITFDFNPKQNAGGANTKKLEDIITLMDSMIGVVDGARADLGAIQNHISALKKIESFNSNALLAA